jgi:hypothetical protein
LGFLSGVSDPDPGDPNQCNAVQIHMRLGIYFIFYPTNPIFSFLGTSASYSSKDKASRKQLAWERGREEFMQGNSWRKQQKKHHRKPQQQKKHHRKPQQQQQRPGKKPVAGVKRPPKKKQKR